MQRGQKRQRECKDGKGMAERWQKDGREMAEMVGGGQSRSDFSVSRAQKPGLWPWGKLSRGRQNPPSEKGDCKSHNKAFHRRLHAGRDHYFEDYFLGKINLLTKKENIPLLVCEKFV